MRRLLFAISMCLCLASDVDAWPVHGNPCGAQTNYLLGDGGCSDYITDDDGNRMLAE